MRRVAGGWSAWVLLCAAACSSSPAHPPAAPVRVFTQRPPLSQHATMLADVGGTAVVALDLPAFESLPQKERVAAAGLARAAEQAFAPAIDSSYRHNVEIAKLLRGILARPDVVPASVLGRIRSYARVFWVNGGVHDAITGRKRLPAFTFGELRAAALAAQAAGADLGMRAGRLELGLRALEGAMFDPRVDALRLARPAGQDPLLASATNLYAGVSSRDLAGFTERAPQSTRLVRDGNVISEHPVDLARVADALEALPQRPELLIAFLRAPDPERYRAVERMWITAPGTIDSAFGFFDVSADPRGRKGLFGAIAGVEDSAPPVRVPSLQAAVTQELLLVSGGALRPLGDPALALGAGTPQRRVLAFSAAALAGADAGGRKLAEELAPPALRDAFVRCDGEVQLARALLRDATAEAGPLATLGFDGPAAADARAYAAADAMAITPAAAPLFSDAGCQELYPRIVASRWLASAADAPEDGHLDAHGVRALWLEASFVAAKGAVHDRREGGKRYVDVDRARFAEAAGELVRLFDEVEKTGNAARLAELFEQQGARVDLATRDEMNERLHAIPRHVAVVPPRIVPVPETVGGEQRVADARAVPITDLDEEVLRALQAL